jgi:hypothetical protein
MSVGGPFLGTDEYDIAFINSAGVVTGQADVYPATTLPPAFPPAGAPLQKMYVATIPAFL